MVKFRCENCGYKFAPKDNSKTQPPRACPYCNRKDSVVLEKTAEQLLNEFSARDID